MAGNGRAVFAEEAEALDAIFGSEVTCSPSSAQVHMEHRSVAFLMSLSVPLNYPFGAPVVHVTPRQPQGAFHISSVFCQRLQEIVQDECLRMSGVRKREQDDTGILFDVVSFAREQLDDVMTRSKKHNTTRVNQAKVDYLKAKLVEKELVKRARAVQVWNPLTPVDLLGAFDGLEAPPLDDNGDIVVKPACNIIPPPQLVHEWMLSGLGPSHAHLSISLEPLCQPQHMAMRDAFKRRYWEVAAHFKSPPQLHVCYHGTRRCSVPSIVKHGLRVPGTQMGDITLEHRTDSGFYGKGIYLSPSLRMAKDYSEGCVFVCLVLMGRRHRMIETRHGCELQNGSDSHACGQEYVVFDSAQVLTCYLAEFQE